MDEEEIRKKVRENYGSIARGNKTHFTTGEGSCCGSVETSCCGSSIPEDLSKEIGYTEDEMAEVPEGSNLGLGCGNPVALASIKPGQTVLDLGSGAGFDCFLAANRVGPSGRVIGVDMTADMIDKARENASRAGITNVEFRKGYIEELPVEDSLVDVVISNCVINLSPEKDRVFAEAYRVIKPGGRIMVSDLVLNRPLPEGLQNSITAYVGCVSGADMKHDYLKRIEKAGFEDIYIVDETPFPLECLADEITIKNLVEETGMTKDELSGALEDVTSVKVRAIKTS